jgi:hypothetical protein
LGRGGKDAFLEAELVEMVSSSEPARAEVNIRGGEIRDVGAVKGDQARPVAPVTMALHLIQPGQCLRPSAFVQAGNMGTPASRDGPARLASSRTTCAQRSRTWAPPANCVW